jgi:hypothetical protein
MRAHAPAPVTGQAVELDIFCTRIDEAYRVYVRPTWLPDYLLDCFDEQGEAFPVYLDFEELDRHMRKSGVEYVKRPGAFDCVQLYAQGAAATVMSVWLSQSFASGERCG